MKPDLATALDQCLERMSRGETVEQCTARYPELQQELTALLQTAGAVSSTPKVAPSAEFRQRSHAHVMSVVREQSRDSSPAHEARRPSLGSGWPRFFGVLQPFAAVALVVIMAISLWLITSPGSVRAAEYTLTILRGTAEVQSSDPNGWTQGVDGQTLTAGSRVRTSANSYAVLTFVDGSTAKLEPNTDVTVSTSQYQGELSAIVALEQKTGRLWNYVQTSGPTPPSYAVNTDAARVVAHGTAFLTEVDAAGTTTVTAIEGVVDVRASKEKVSLGANEQTSVKPGSIPMAAKQFPDQDNALIVETNAAVGSVLDPTGSSTGTLPNGVSFNQITNSKADVTSGGQNIQITQPTPGAYSVVVRSLSTGPSEVTIRMKVAGQNVTAYSGTLAGGTDWVITVNVPDGSDKTAAAAATPSTTVQPLGTQKVENVVETKIALQNAVPVNSTATATKPNTSTPVLPGAVSPTTTTGTKPTATATISPTTTAPTPTLAPTIPPATPTPTDVKPPPTTTIAPPPTVSPTDVKPAPTVTPSPTTSPPDIKPAPTPAPTVSPSPTTSVTTPPKTITPIDTAPTAN